MCGRFALYRDSKELAEHFNLEGTPEARPRYNIAPSQKSLIVRAHPETGHRELAALRWGLVPHWAKDAKVGYSLINARSETAATKPAFRESMRHRRCLVATDGWYEWKVTPAGKVPTFIQKVNGSGELATCFFAGLWATWRDKEKPDGAWLETFTILTRDAASTLREIHDRMPVVLPEAEYAAWLDHSVTAPAAVELLENSAREGFTYYPVSTHVNNPKNDDATCIDEVPRSWFGH